MSSPLPLVIYGRRKRSDCLQERERLVVWSAKGALAWNHRKNLPFLSLHELQPRYSNYLKATTQVEKGKLCMIDPFVVFQQNTSKWTLNVKTWNQCKANPLPPIYTLAQSDQTRLTLSTNKGERKCEIWMGGYCYQSLNHLKQEIGKNWKVLGNLWFGKRLSLALILSHSPVWQVENCEQRFWYILNFWGDIWEIFRFMCQPLKCCHFTMKTENIGIKSYKCMKSKQEALHFLRIGFSSVSSGKILMLVFHQVVTWRWLQAFSLDNCSH